MKLDRTRSTVKQEINADALQREHLFMPAHDIKVTWNADQTEPTLTDYSAYKSTGYHIGKLVECEKCSLKFRNKMNYDCHVRICGTNHRYACPFCPELFVSRMTYWAHSELHPNQLQYACPLCNARFLKLSTVRMHMKQAHVFLMKQLGLTAGEIIHIEQPQEEEDLICPMCGENFQKRCFDYELHLQRNHRGMRTFKCTLCDRMFASQRLLDQHRNYFHVEASSVCHLCGAVLKNKIGLQVHLTNTHFIANCSCPDCGKVFKSERCMKRHRTTSHVDVGRFVCDECGRAFNKTADLKKHKRIHTGELPYPCEVCGKKFRQKGTLNTHTRIHTKVKPYECSKCGMTFSQRCSLHNHKKKCNH